MVTHPRSKKFHMLIESRMGNDNKKEAQDVNRVEPQPTPVASGSDEFKIIPLGEDGVGKSALIVKFISNVFVTEYDPTIEEQYTKPLELSDQSVMLSILDISGAESFSSMLDSWIRTGRGFLLVYSINNRKSFDKCVGIYESVTRIKDSDHVPVVLVGNKSDMAEREVSRAEGEELAKRYGWPFFETSAKHGVNVNEVFLELAKIIQRMNIKPTPKK